VAVACGAVCFVKFEDNKKVLQRPAVKQSITKLFGCLKFR
jgi:hypothetical protein